MDREKQIAYETANKPIGKTHSYLVDKDGKLTIDLSYPDEVDVQEDVSDRRPRAVKKYFGDVKLVFDDPFA
jgi:hypothetical protein